jgi:hypothetical protein
MKLSMDRRSWTGPLGVARIIGILSATWVLVWSLAGMIGLASFSAKIFVPMGIMLASVAFIAGYQMGQSKRP